MRGDANATLGGWRGRKLLVVGVAATTCSVLLPATWLLLPADGTPRLHMADGTPRLHMADGTPRLHMPRSNNFTSSTPELHVVWSRGWYNAAAPPAGMLL